MRRAYPAMVLGFLMVLAAPAAFAGFYVGGSVGQTSSDVGYVDTGFSGVSVDDSDTGFKLFGGYNVIKFFAVEAAYVDVSGPSVSTTVPVQTSVSTTASGFAVDAMGVLPIGQKFEVFAKYGWYVWDGEATASLQGQTIASGSTDGTDPNYGLGFGWNMFSKGSLRFEAERYAMEGMDVDMYSLGFAYRF